MTWKHTLAAGVLGALTLVCAGLPATARGDAADQPPSAPLPPEKQAEGAAADQQGSARQRPVPFPQRRQLGGPLAVRGPLRLLGHANRPAARSKSASIRTSAPRRSTTSTGSAATGSGR